MGNGCSLTTSHHNFQVYAGYEIKCINIVKYFIICNLKCFKLFYSISNDIKVDRTMKFNIYD